GYTCRGDVQCQAVQRAGECLSCTRHMAMSNLSSLTSWICIRCQLPEEGLASEVHSQGMDIGLGFFSRTRLVDEGCHARGPRRTYAGLSPVGRVCNHFSSRRRGFPGRKPQSWSSMQKRCTSNRTNHSSVSSLSPSHSKSKLL